MLMKDNNICRYVTICLTVFFSNLFFLSCFNAKTGLPAIPKASIFLDETDRNNYKVNPQLQRAELFRWDFSNNNQYVYSYLKKSIVNDFSTIFGTELGKNTTKINLHAKLFVNSLKNQAADLILKDIETVVEYLSDDSNEKQTEKKISNIPSTVIASIDEGGVEIAKKNNEDLFTGLLFPLPNRPLKPKEQITINKSIPIAVNDKIYTLVGDLKITLTDYVILNGRDCARFEVIADVKNPNNLKGNGKCAIKTNTVYYFDIESHCLLAGGSAVLQSIRYEDAAAGQKNINDNHFLILLKLEREDLGT